MTEIPEGRTSEFTRDQMKQAMGAHIRASETPEARQRYIDHQKSYFKKVQPTYIEAWPKELCSLSIAQIDIPLTVQDAIAFGSNIAEYGESFGPRLSIDAIRAEAVVAVESFPWGAMVRLGSRSPKDSWSAYNNGMKITVENDPFSLMLDCSERMYEDLTLAIQNNYGPHIFVRQWIDIPQWSEFRCFMQNRQLVGISQYFYPDGEMHEISKNADSIEWVIKHFFDDGFRKSCHLDDVVFDVFVKMREKKSIREWEVRLLEINPFFEMTDPCLFDWRNGGSDFDGSFRYIGKK